MKGRTTRATARSRSTNSSTTSGDPKALAPAVTRRATGKQRAVVFSFFEVIPLDIFGEVIGCLEPADVLHLGRTGKGLRTLLMNQSMAVYWKRARENIEGLPACPDDLSEPAYANLMFSAHCHKCLAENRDVLMHLEARVQLCYKCSLEEFKKWKDLPQKVDESLIDFIPATTEPLTAPERKQSQKAQSARWRVEERTRFHVATVLNMHRQYANLRKGGEKVKWLKEQRAAWNSVEEHAMLCRVYSRGGIPENEADAVQMFVQRRERMLQELSKLGYKDEFENCGMFSLTDTPAAGTMYPLTSTARKLTDKEWEIIKVPMIAYMEEVRVVLVEKRKAKLVRDTFTALYTQAYFQYTLARPPRISALPRIHEVAMMQEFRPHLQVDALNEDVTRDALRNAAKIIPELMENRASEVEGFFLGLVRRASVYHGQNIDSETLFYATTMFHCSTCGQIQPYPEALAHECFYKMLKIKPSAAKKTEGRSGENSPADEANEAVLRRAFEGTSWAPGSRVRFSDEAYHHTLSVLSSLEMAATTTTQALHNLNPYVELACKCYKVSSRDSTQVRQATRWTEAIQQVSRHRSGDYENALRALDEAEVEGVPGYEARFASPWRDNYICPLCGHIWATQAHFTEEHGLNQAQAAALYQNTAKEWRIREYRLLTLP